MKYTLIGALLCLAFSEGFTTTSVSTKKTSSCTECQMMQMKKNKEAVNRRQVFGAVVAGATSSMLLIAKPQEAQARLEGVNKPELLPSEPGKNVIQVEKMLTKGQEKRMEEDLANLEKRSGFRVRVLCQSYPRTPGLAIRDYWDLGKEDSKDDKYVVLVVDEFGGRSNVLNFNVGEGVKFALPNVFWTRLSSKYGSLFYVKENGLDTAIINAIDAIVTCLSSEDAYCVNVPEGAMDVKGFM